MLKNISLIWMKMPYFLGWHVLANKIIEWLDMSKNVL